MMTVSLLLSIQEGLAQAAAIDTLMMHKLQRATAFLPHPPNDNGTHILNDDPALRPKVTSTLAYGNLR